MFKTGWVITCRPGTSIVRSCWDGVYNMVQSGWNLRETQRHQRHPIASVPRLWWGIIRKSRTCRWPQDFFFLGCCDARRFQRLPASNLNSHVLERLWWQLEMTGIWTHVMWVMWVMWWSHMFGSRHVCSFAAFVALAEGMKRRHEFDKTNLLRIKHWRASAVSESRGTERRKM